MVLSVPRSGEALATIIAAPQATDAVVRLVGDKFIADKNTSITAELSENQKQNIVRCFRPSLQKLPFAVVFLTVGHVVTKLFFSVKIIEMAGVAEKITLKF